VSKSQSPEFDLAGSRTPLACDWGQLCAGDRDWSFCRSKAEAELWHLDWNGINLADKLIDITKSKNSISHRFVKISDNLFACSKIELSSAADCQGFPGS
jgi:hypothetical protein